MKGLRRPQRLGMTRGIRQQMTPRTVAEIEREMQEELARETASGTPEAARAGALRKQITDRVSEDPEMVAKTIRSWLNDEK